MNRVIALAFFTAAGSSSALAQTSSDATLQALLTEVRLLRQTLERSATVTPRIQVTLQRMQLQQDGVARASRELEDVRNQLAKSRSEAAGVAGQIAALEAQAPQEQDAGRRKAMEDEAKRMKSQSPQADYQMVAREAEMAGRLQAELTKLGELNDQLNNLERVLDAPQPKQP